MRAVIAGIWAVLACCVAVFAAAPATAADTRRLALVIGNAAYTDAGRLINSDIL